MLPPLYNNKWVHFKWKGTLPLHAVWIIWQLNPRCPASLSTCQGSGTGADMINDLVFMGRDGDVRAAGASPDIRLRPLSAVGKVQQAEYTWGWLVVLVCVYVCVCVQHVLPQKYRVQREAPVMRITWPESNAAHRGTVKGGVPSSKTLCSSTLSSHRLNHPPVVLKNVFSPVWCSVSHGSNSSSYVSLTVTADGEEPW